MKTVLLAFISILIFSGSAAAQNGETVTVVGDSLLGRNINGESVREVYGNVSITQGNVHITCNKAIQYLSRNSAELIGNVILVQDTITVRTNSGYYNGNEKSAFSDSDVSLEDGHMLLNAKHGYYYTEEQRAYFYGNVRLKDSTSDMRADRLNYYDEENKAVAAGNVSVSDTSAVLFADSLIHHRNEKVTLGFNNVRVYNRKNNLSIFGNELTDSSKTSYTKISGNPLLVQIDTADSGRIDTLFIAARLMESFGRDQDKLIATDSVKIVRGDFASLNGISILYRSEDRIFTYQREQDPLQPILWSGDSQLAGDTVNIYLKKNNLDWIDIRGNAFMLSSNPGFKLRYDQISGKNVKMYFGEHGLDKMDVLGNVLSIYYLYEDESPNGLIKSSAENAKVFFDSSRVSDVRMYQSVVSEYYPDNLVDGKEKDFTLPSFRIFEGRPDKNSVSGIKKDYFLSPLNQK